MFSKIKSHRTSIMPHATRRAEHQLSANFPLPTRRVGDLKPLAFHRHHPGGMVENNPVPPLRDRDRRERASSPEGTAESDRVNRPSGTYPSQTSNPAPPRRDRAIVPARRDPSWTKGTSLASNRGGIGAGALRSIAFVALLSAGGAVAQTSTAADAPSSTVEATNEPTRL